MRDLSPYGVLCHRTGPSAGAFAGLGLGAFAGLKFPALVPPVVTCVVQWSVGALAGAAWLRQERAAVVQDALVGTLGTLVGAFGGASSDATRGMIVLSGVGATVGVVVVGACVGTIGG